MSKTTIGVHSKALKIIIRKNLKDIIYRKPLRKMKFHLKLSPQFNTTHGLVKESYTLGS